MNAAAAIDRLLPAIGLRLVSVGLFATMNVAIKLAERAGASLREILFFRQFGAALLVATIIAAGPGFVILRTQRPGAHVLRTVIGLGAMGLTFATLFALPLAEATTISFSMPIFATILGALVLGEATGWRRWAAVLAGFAGVLIVAQPGSGHFPLWGALTGLGAALGTASVSILLRTIGRTEPMLTIVFWFSALSLIPLGVVFAFTAQSHAPGVWALLMTIGVIGGMAQLAMTTSLKLVAVSLVVPMDYTALLWATLFGWLVFGTLPTPSTWIGAPLIVGSGLYIVWRAHHRHRAETARALPEA